MVFSVTNLTISVENTCVVDQLCLNIKKGEIHAIMGPNGSGKSSLVNALIGHPSYIVTSGSIILNEQDLVGTDPHVRSRAGLFVSFQYPISIPGVEVYRFLHEICFAAMGDSWNLDAFNKQLYFYVDLLSLDRSLLSRSLHDGFSGGERKKLEILQMLLLKPKIAILDEIDSGLDIDALASVAHGISYARQENPELACIIITHYQRILHHIIPDRVHILNHAKLIQSGDANLAKKIDALGYQERCV